MEYATRTQETSGRSIEPGCTSSRTIAVYADTLLPPSMTFVRAQAEALQDFTPIYVGTRAARGGLRLPPERTVILNTSGTTMGKVREIPFKVFGKDPLFERRMRRLSPALIHAHFGPAAVVALPLADALQVPLICTFHGYDATVRPEFAGSFTHRKYVRHKSRLIRRCNIFIAVSAYIRDQLLRQAFPEDRVVQHYIGVDTIFFASDNRQEREPIVLFVGRLTEKKGCEFAIRAMEMIQRDRPQCELVVIGDGPLRLSLEQLAARHLRNYRFLGTQPPEMIRYWMNLARVFCVPSLVATSGDAEGFGMVFVEAQAMQLPVVSFSSAGVPEAVAHGETGFLAPERDWRQLARYISDLLGNEVLWRQFSHAARIRVCRYFNLEVQTRKLEQLYCSAIESFGGRSDQ